MRLQRVVNRDLKCAQIAVILIARANFVILLFPQIQLQFNINDFDKQWLSYINIGTKHYRPTSKNLRIVILWARLSKHICSRCLGKVFQ